MFYAIYNKITGQITQICQTNDYSSLAPLVNDNYGALECVESTTNDKFYVDVNTNTFVQFPAKPAPYDTWDWNTHSWVDSRTLQQAKDQKWTQIKLERDAAISAPLSTPYGTFDADANSRANIANAVLYLQTLEQQGTPGTVDWTLVDNTTVTLNYQEMSTVGLLLGQRTNAAYDTGRALRLQIDAATTIAEVDAIQWPVLPE